MPCPSSMRVSQPSALAASAAPSAGALRAAVARVGDDEDDQLLALRLSDPIVGPSHLVTGAATFAR